MFRIWTQQLSSIHRTKIFSNIFRLKPSKAKKQKRLDKEKLLKEQASLLSNQEYVDEKEAQAEYENRRALLFPGAQGAKLPILASEALKKQSIDYYDADSELYDWI